MIAGALARWAGVAALLVSWTTAGNAQDAAQFYKGRTIELNIGYTVGGGYDLRARLVARHMWKHIPGHPIIVPKNMEGAGSVRLANWLANVAPRDGTVIGTIGRGTAFDPILGQKGAQFKGPDFAWIGSTNDEISICNAMATSGVATFEELMTKELVLGAVSMSDDTGQFARVLSRSFGAKLKVVTGYPGGNDIVLAMERGEVQGRCGWSWSSVKAIHKNWLEQKKINILVQFGLNKHPDLADTPLVLDLAKTDEQRQTMTLIFARQTIGWPVLAPPGVPHDRVQVLRQALMDTMNDKDFLAEAASMNLEVTPVSGERLQRLVQELYMTPPAIAQKAAELLN